MSEFIVPPVEEVKPTVSSEEAASEAFYAAATSSNNPEQDYTVAKADLELTGESSFVNMAKEAWKNEQDVNIRNSLESIIADTSIPPSEKKIVLQTYALTGFIEPSLREKYVQQTAAKQIGPTTEDIAAQDIIVDTINQRRKVQQVESTVEKSKKFVNTLLDSNTKKQIRQSIIGTGAAITDIVMGIPAGLGKIYTLLVDKDVEKAKQLEEKI